MEYVVRTVESYQVINDFVGISITYKNTSITAALLEVQILYNALFGDILECLNVRFDIG